MSIWWCEKRFTSPPLGRIHFYHRTICPENFTQPYWHAIFAYHRRCVVVTLPRNVPQKPPLLRITCYLNTKIGCNLILGLILSQIMLIVRNQRNYLVIPNKDRILLLCLNEHVSVYTVHQIPSSQAKRKLQTSKWATNELSRYDLALHESSTSSVVTALDRCAGGHGLDSHRVRECFLCPKFVTTEYSIFLKTSRNIQQQQQELY